MAGKFVCGGSSLSDTIGCDEGPLLLASSGREKLEVLRIEFTTKRSLVREQAVDLLAC